MSEFVGWHEANSMFASKNDLDKKSNKSTANTALGIGIGALALSVLNRGGLGGLLGGVGSSTDIPCTDDRYVNKDTFWAQNVGLEKEFGQLRYDGLKQNYDTYVTLDNKITDLEKKVAVNESTIPLAFELAKVNAERYADNKVYHEAYKQGIINCGIEQQLSHKVDGTIGLPWSSIISGIPTMPDIRMVTRTCRCSAQEA